MQAALPLPQRLARRRSRWLLTAPAPTIAPAFPVAAHPKTSVGGVTKAPPKKAKTAAPKVFGADSKRLVQPTVSFGSAPLPRAADKRMLNVVDRDADARNVDDEPGRPQHEARPATPSRGAKRRLDS